MHLTHNDPPNHGTVPSSYRHLCNKREAVVLMVLRADRTHAIIDM
jgi:hypothetical protein